MVAPSMEQRAIWSVPERDLLAEARLMEELGVPSLVAAVLVNRGFRDPAVAHAFLNPSLDQLHAPSLLPDYQEAVKAILGARERKETIYVHGDYDVDGVTSASLFTRFLKRIGCDVVPHVPHRIREGYGIHMNAIQWAKDHGAQLFLTCDCGISAHEQVKAARDAGMTVVVTDHHLVGETLPEAVAVVNPHRADSHYPFAELCGVGVALKLCAGLTEELGFPVDKFYRAYLDLAVLGTVADVMPLVDENRVITKFGLEALKSSQKIGIRALMQVSNLTQVDKLTPRSIGFQLGPRINAVGRIDDSALALDLMMTDDPAAATQLAYQLDRVNTERKDRQNRAVEAAIERVMAQGLDQSFTLLLADPDWHAGVIGLIAGRLVEKFRRPAFVLTVQDGIAKGSARSIPGFDLGEAIRAAKGIVLGGGGHEMAAGFSVEESKIPELSKAFEDMAQQCLTPEHFASKIVVDAEIQACEATPRVAVALSMLEPYGCGNLEPAFRCTGVQLSSVVPTSNPEHVKLTLTTDDGVRNGMAFGIGTRLSDLKLGSKIDIAFTTDENVFNGRASYRWLVQDFQSCED